MQKTYTLDTWTFEGRAPDDDAPLFVRQAWVAPPDAPNSIVATGSKDGPVRFWVRTAIGWHILYPGDVLADIAPGVIAVMPQ